MVRAARAGYRSVTAAMRIGLALAGLVAGLLLPLTALALGIGSIETRSVTGEPLDARIPLFPSTMDWVEDVEAGLARDSVFQRAGVEQVAELERLRFAVVDVPGGTPYIQVSSEGPIDRSFLAFVLEVRWGGGRLLREYTVLLDPPVLLADGPAAPIVRPAPEPAAGPGGIIARTREPGEETAPPQAAEPAGEADTGAAEPAGTPSRQVIRNETLWGIASELSAGQDVSVYQMMVALYRANPDAFIDENMNLLRAGAVLQLPAVDEVARLQAAAARDEFARQVAAWDRTRVPVGDPAMAIARAEAGSGPDRPADLLRVVAAGELDGDDVSPGLGSDAAPMRELREEVTILRETEASLESERNELERMNEELRTRIAALERLINIEAAPDAGRLAESAALSRDAAAAVTTEEDGQPPFWADPRVLSAAALALLFLVLLVLLRRRRAREESRMASLPEDPLDGEPSAPVAEGSRSRRRRTPPAAGTESTAPARPASGRTAEMNSRRFWSTFEPAEEADYYFARRQYGRVVDLLKMALLERVDEPRLWLRLLEAQRSADDRVGFVASAERLRRLLGDDNSTYWRSVVRMGQQFVPGHALFTASEKDAVVARQEPERPVRAAKERASGETGVIGTAYGAANGDVPLTATGSASGPRSILTWSAIPGDIKPPGDLAIEAGGVVPVSVPGGLIEGSISGSAGKSAGTRDERLSRARRYLQNGDREMALSLLEDVMEQGDRQEQSEARALYQRLR